MSNVYAKLLLTLLEMLVRKQRQDKRDVSKKRLQEARRDPAAYLRQLGRVSELPAEQSDTMRGDGSDAGRDSGN